MLDQLHLHIHFKDRPSTVLVAMIRGERFAFVYDKESESKQRLIDELLVAARDPELESFTMDDARMLMRWADEMELK